MKKLSYLSICLGILCLTFSSCKKEKQTELVDNTPKEEHTIEVENGVLTFKKVQSYEAFADDFENAPEKAMRLVNNMNFSSLYDLAQFDEEGEIIFDSTQVEYPEFLLRVLNQDTVVHIGEYYIKLDPKNELVYLLHQDKLEHYSALVQKTKNEHISLLSTDDDVIETLLEGNVSENTNKVTNNANTSRVSSLNWDWATNPPRWDIKRTKRYAEESFRELSSSYSSKAFISYRKLGIYFTLNGGIQNSQQKFTFLWVRWAPNVSLSHKYDFATNNNHGGTRGTVDGTRGRTHKRASLTHSWYRGVRSVGKADIKLACHIWTSESSFITEYLWLKF